MPLTIVEECSLGRTTRTIKHPAWMKDFTTIGKNQGGTRYPLGNYVSCDNAAPTYQSSLTKFLNFVEPIYFEEVVKVVK